VEDNGISFLGGLKDRFATFGTPKDGLFHGLFVNPIGAATTKQKNAEVVLKLATFPVLQTIPRGQKGVVLGWEGNQNGRPFWAPQR